MCMLDMIDNSRGESGKSIVLRWCERGCLMLSLHKNKHKQDVLLTSEEIHIRRRRMIFCVMSGWKLDKIPFLVPGKKENAYLRRIHEYFHQLKYYEPYRITSDRNENSYNIGGLLSKRNETI